MDVIAWTVGLIAGITHPSLKLAVGIGVAASIALRVHGYFFQGWGDTMPQDLFGAAAMLAVTGMFAWVGSIVRTYRARRSTTAAS